MAPLSDTPRRVAVGSRNPIKLAAVRAVMLKIWPQARVIAVDVSSGVSEMPANGAEGRQGARQRAIAARALADADLGVGLEGALDASAEGMYITNWVALVDREGTLGMGNGGWLPLPASVADELRAGAELGPIIDRLSGQAHSKQRQGAAGFFTRGIVARQTAFEIGVAFALAPFLRRSLYHPQ